MLLYNLHAYTASPIRCELSLFGVSALKGETLLPTSILQLRLITHPSGFKAHFAVQTDEGLVQKHARLWRGLRTKSLERGSDFLRAVSAFSQCFELHFRINRLQPRGWELSGYPLMRDSFSTCSLEDQRMRESWVWAMDASPVINQAKR